MIDDDAKGRDFPSRSLDKVVVRLPDGMRDRLKDSAELLGRSVNSEIVKRLEQSFADQDSAVIKLDLHADIWNTLSQDAAVKDMTMHERASEILRIAYVGDGNFGTKTDYTRTLEKVSEVYEKVFDLEDRNSALREQLEKDFILYFNKTVQIKNLIVFLKQDNNTKLSPQMRNMIDDLNRLIESEAEVFESRYDFAMRQLQNKALSEQDDDGTMPPP